MTKYYRSQDGQFIFKFSFVDEEDEIAVYCLSRPTLNGQDPDPHKTHQFSSGQLCFAGGQAPTDQSRAEELAAQWAEYIIDYRRYGVAQS